MALKRKAPTSKSATGTPQKIALTGSAKKQSQTKWAKHVLAKVQGKRKNYGHPAGWTVQYYGAHNHGDLARAQIRSQIEDLVGEKLLTREQTDALAMPSRGDSKKCGVPLDSITCQRNTVA